MTVERASVAVFGVGTMGHGIVDSLLRAGIPTIVWDRDPAAAAALAGQGAMVAVTAYQAISSNAAEVRSDVAPLPDHRILWKPA